MQGGQGAQWPPYGYQYQQAPPQYYRPMPPYQPQYRPRAITPPEDIGRRGAMASLIFGAIGIGGHALGCCWMPCWGVLALLGCSVTAFVVGWMSLSAATAPDVRDDARLGRAIGFLGIVAAIIFIIVIQVPYWRHAMEIQAAIG
jgi:MFS family permease